MRVLRFDSFKERLNINRINIKDIDVSNISHKNMFPKPGMRLKPSLEDGMIVLVDVGDYSYHNWKYRCYHYRSKFYDFYCADGLLQLSNYDADLTYKGDKNQWTIIKIYGKDPEININMTSDGILKKLKTKKPIWVREGYENVQI